LIDRWQGYLKESIVRAEKEYYQRYPRWYFGGIGGRPNYSDDELEKRWKNHVEREAYFHGPPQEFDEGVIRCWEGCLSKMHELDSN
jgi:hypothetical protein